MNILRSKLSTLGSLPPCCDILILFNLFILVSLFSSQGCSYQQETEMTNARSCNKMEMKWKSTKKKSDTIKGKHLLFMFLS